MGKITSIAAVLLMTSIWMPASAGTWYVDGSAPEFGHGSSWYEPLETIQEGIDAASHGDTVIVAEGTYNENIRFNGKNIVLRSTDPTDAFVRRNTIIDGEFLGSVVTFDGTEDHTCVLAGFTVENGSARIGAGVYGAGLGGMATHATIENNVITSNVAHDWGGGVVYCDGVIQNNVISDNVAWNSAGLYACDGIIQDNVISGNSANAEGSFVGGLGLCGGIIRNNVIANNSAANSGGLGGCDGIIVNCIIWGNTASSSAQVGGSSQPTYCCIQDWTGGGEGNISENPRFVKGGYQLQADSPCIDVGRNDYWMWDAVDLDGNPRVLQGGSSSKVVKVDMGAYEYFDGADRTPPYVWDRDPAPDALEVPLSADIVLRVKDQLSGVDETSIVVMVNGVEVTPTITGTPADYMVSYDPPSDLAFSETVTVTVEAADLSSPSNVMDRVTYIFTTIREPSPVTTWYVDGSVSVSGDGTSPETAFKMIQEGIDEAWHGDTVIAAQGTYMENIRFESRNITLRSTDPSDPAVVANTIIDGDQYGPVVTFSGTENETCVLSGFTIRNGKALNGAGICGGTPVGHTHASVENNAITGNSADAGGGVAWCDGIIRGNTISGNSVGIAGGGLSRCDGVIEENIISGNSGVVGGGLFRCDGLVQNNEILENSAGYGGGLVWCEGPIRNNLIAGNSAGTDGGGLAYSNNRLVNNTIVHNSAGRSGGGVRMTAATVRNCILWGNWAPDGPQISEIQPDLGYSCIQDWTGGGEGNIAPPEGPGFVDYAGGDYHLSENSPCIDTGKNDDWVWDAVDLDGNLRGLFGASSLTVDMGAYEYYDETLVDTSSPYESKLIPAPGATGVQVDSSIGLHLKDDGQGVSKSSIVMTVNGLQVSPTITGTPSDFTLSYNPPLYFDLNQTVAVTVDAQDRCSPAKEMEQVEYSFTTTPDDVIPPEITLSGEPTIMLLVGSSFDDPGYIAMDHPDGEITSNVVVSDPPDLNVVGTYALRYNVSDAAGNPAAERTRTVKVVKPLQVTMIAGPPEPVALIWEGKEEFTYRVWSCSELTGGQWHKEAVLPYQEPQMFWVDFTPSSACKFYRIEIR